jgi:hypothetical protein
MEQYEWFDGDNNFWGDLADWFDYDSEDSSSEYLEIADADAGVDGDVAMVASKLHELLRIARHRVAGDARHVSYWYKRYGVIF